MERLEFWLGSSLRRLVVRVFITGSNRGIGLEYVRQLLARGEQVFAGCRTPDKATELHTLKKTYPETLAMVGLDVTEPASVEAAYQAVQSHMPALDLVINNAGVNPNEESLGNIQKADFMRAFEVNVAGAMLVSQQFFPLLKEGTNPKLVHIGSGAGSLALGGVPELYSYCVSKAALNMFHRMLEKDLKSHGIISIVQNPGWVVTDMGGPNAELDVADSVKQQLAVIDKLTPADSGAFRDYTGEPIAW